MKRFLVVALLISASHTPLHAQARQHTRPQSPATAPKEANQFDFLIGHWDLTVRPKASSIAARIHGAPKLLGTWKAWKALDGFGVEDELRVIDASGNPSALSHSLRVWSPSERQWLVTTADAYRGRLSSATATMISGSMEARGRGADPSGAPILTRSRFVSITPQAFRFVQDRSTDDGKTWDEAVLVIEAKRVAATAPR